MCIINKILKIFIFIKINSFGSLKRDSTDNMIIAVGITYNFILSYPLVSTKKSLGFNHFKFGVFCYTLTDSLCEFCLSTFFGLKTRVCGFCMQPLGYRYISYMYTILVYL